MKSKFKFYTKIKGTIINCHKVRNLQELLIQNLDELSKNIKEDTLPMQILISLNMLDDINKEVARIACSRYHTECIRIYINQTINPVIEIRSV